MIKNYQKKNASRATSDELDLPDAVSVAMADIAGSVKDGLLALAVAAGLQVMTAMMDESVTAVAGPKGRHQPERSAVRHGSEAGSVVLGGRRVPVRRPRVRATDGSGEVAVDAYDVFNDSDLLGDIALERMMAKLSTRRYRAGLEPVGSDVEAKATSTSKSAVSRRFVARTEVALGELMAADLSGLDIVALMVDGVHFAGHCCVVALGVDIDGTKHPLGVVEGDTENATVVKDLLVDLRERGLDVTRPVLVVIDGAKALASAVNSVFDPSSHSTMPDPQDPQRAGEAPEGGRCDGREEDASGVYDPDPLTAEATLEDLARSLAKSHPGAAGSLREGLTETLTVSRLEVAPTLARSLRSTNAIESMIGICRDHSSNVKRWRDGKMALRWCAAGMGQASKQFRRVNGHLHLPVLRQALDDHIAGAVTPTCDDGVEAA